MIIKRSAFPYVIAALLCLVLSPSALHAQAGTTVPPPLLITPEVLDIGILSPGGHIKGIFYMRSSESAALKWWTTGPGEWLSKGNRKLTGQMKDSLGYLEVGLKFAGDEPEGGETQTVQMILESQGETLILEKTLPLGNHSEKVEVTFAGGVQVVQIRFATALRQSDPEIRVEPESLDFGIVEGAKTVVKKLKVRNGGKGTLVWRTGLQGERTSIDGQRVNKKGFYISFQNDERLSNDEYLVPGRLESELRLTGQWLAKKGYPACSGNGSLTYGFSGTGIALMMRTNETGGKVHISVDDGASVELNLSAKGGERTVYGIEEDLTEGPHVLKVTTREGYMEIEGVRIYGSDILSGVPGWIKVFPMSGTTRSETDFVSVTVYTENLKAGRYSENVLIQSNGGLAVVDASLRVTRDRASAVVDIYRYVKGDDYLYTGQPEMEDYNVFRHYRKQRLAFRLFREDTPGTRKFYRWYHAVRGDHYYSSDPEGGGRRSLQGYVLEGSIGNIGTLKIHGTRELYRWHHPVKGTHFYTTDMRGEGMARKGYRFDGIAGYVR